MPEINEENGENQGFENEVEPLEETSTPPIQETFLRGRNDVPALGRTLPLMNDADYLAKRVDSQIAWYEAKSKENKMEYQRLKNLEFVIAATIPVVVSLSTMKIMELPLVPNYLSIGGLLQVASAIGGVFLVIFNKRLELKEYHKLWKEYRSSAEALEHEKFLYLTNADPYNDTQSFERFVLKIEAIRMNEAQKWKQTAHQVIVQQQPPQTAPQGTAASDAVS